MTKVVQINRVPADLIDDFPPVRLDVMCLRDEEQANNFINETQTGARKIVSVRAIDTTQTA